MSQRAASKAADAISPLAGEPATRRSGIARMGALESPAYRRFWFGSFAAVGGTQLVNLGIGWLVFQLTGSPFNLGIVGAATALPTIVINLFGGVMADRLDRRLLLIGTSLLAGALLSVLAALDATDVVRVWHVVAIAVGLGLVYGLDWPTRNAFFPLLITREQLRSAVALNSVLWQGTRIFAPFIGGVAIAALGTESVFVASAVGFLAMSVVLYTLRVPRTEAVAGRNVVRELAEGIRYIARNRIFAVLIPLTFANMFFGLQYIQLMPAFAASFFPDDSGAASRALGFLFASAGLGAVVGTFVSARMQGARLLGWTMLGSQLLLVVSVWAFAAAGAYALALPIAFLVGFFSSLFLINSMTVLQMRVEDRLRGRVMGIHGITFSLIALGGLFGGALAEITGVRVAVSISAAVLAAIVVLVIVTQREVRALDGRRN
jgi:MFS family permease